MRRLPVIVSRRFRKAPRPSRAAKRVHRRTSHSNPVSIDKLIEQLFAATGIAAIDSCSAETSFMAQLCTGRKAMTDMVVNVGTERSLVFTMEASRQLGYERLRTARDWLRGMSLIPVKRRL